MGIRVSRVLAGTACLLPLLIAAPARAQEDIYIGVGIGQIEYSHNTGDPVLGKISEGAASYKIFGGFGFNEHLALEISYGDTDSIDYRASGNVPPFGNVTDDVEIEFTTSALRAMGQLPLDWGILVGGLGYYSADRKFTEVLVAECCGTLRNGGTIREDGLTALLGIEWRFGRFGTSTGIRLEYEWLDASSNIDLSTFGLGISYRW